jgi:hypothetical protein
MASRVPLVCLAFLAVLLSGCDSAENLVNRRLPPVPEEQQRATAIQASQAAIAGLSDANVGFNLRIEDIAVAVKASGAAERLGVGPLTLRGDRQLILAEAEVAKTFSRNDFPDFDADTKDRIEALKPEIKGRITLGLSLASTNSVSQDGRLAIGIRLLPIFRNTEVDRIALTGKLDVDLVVTLMNALADKLSSELRAEIATVSLPAVPVKEADLSRAIARRNNGGDEKIKIAAKPVSSPVYLRQIAWLVDAGNVTFIAEIAPVGTSPAFTAADPGKDDYAQFKTEFATKLKRGLDIANPAPADWVTISKQLVAELINRALQQAQLCVRFQSSLAKRTFSRRVGIPANVAVDCTPQVDCTPTKDCSTAKNCEQAEDCSSTRDCQVCALGACFNDPACEREKLVASQNCEIRRATRMITCERLGTPQRTACERDRAAEKASCEAGKSATTLACKAGKEAIEKLAKAGNLAAISATVGGSANISICMKEVSVAPSLERLEASAIVRGEGSVDLGIKYVPQGIASYLDCHFPWTVDKRMRIELPEEPARFDAALVLETSAPKPTLRANINGSAFVAAVRPSPREMLLGNYSMRAACTPVGAMLHELTLDVTQSVPDIDGDFSFAGEDRMLVLTLEPIMFQIAGNNVVGNAAYASNAKALILSGDLAAVPAN